MNVYVARQPILDSNKNLYGYELLFRISLNNYFPPDMDGNEATTRLLSNAFFAMCLDRVSGMAHAFINFTKDLLIRKIPMLFPSDRIVIEVLENVEPEPGIIESCMDMVKKGYRIALDDFLFRKELMPIISIASIIKFDLRETPVDEFMEVKRELKGRSIQFLAEKVETYDEFKSARDAGFSLFQGFFFSKPEVLKAKDIPPTNLRLLEMMTEANRSEVDFSRLEKIIGGDVSISYRLLKLVNSVFFRRVNEVNSIRQALVMIGEEGLRRFLSIVAMSGLIGEKPVELVKSSVVRARFCELMGNHSKRDDDPSSLFTVGLFSMIDALLDMPMEEVLKELPLGEDIKNALMGRPSPIKRYLDLARAYEHGSWNLVKEISESLGINEQELPKCYGEAIEWAESLHEL